MFYYILQFPEKHKSRYTNWTTIQVVVNKTIQITWRLRIVCHLRVIGMHRHYFNKSEKTCHFSRRLKTDYSSRVYRYAELELSIHHQRSSVSRKQTEIKDKTPDCYSCPEAPAMETCCLRCFGKSLEGHYRIPMWPINKINPAPRGYPPNTHIETTWFHSQHYLCA